MGKWLQPAILILLLLIALPSVAQTGKEGGLADATFYNPYTNNPPGPPPNYNLVDSSYFQGVPSMPEPLDNHAGGYYIFNDTAAGKWYIANYIFTRGSSLDQFHGCILVTLDQDPAPNVNIWSQGFELSSDLIQNDRWGWVKWPTSIAPNLYEIWWDITIDYSTIHDTGDFRDTLGVSVAGCAIDFNIWSTAHGQSFSPSKIFLGDDMTPLDDVPGFHDTYSGVWDQYQQNNPTVDPNSSRFTSKSLPGATYNKNGLISTGTSYGNRYAGSWAYEANGVQFSTLFCPPSYPPSFVSCEDEDESDNSDEDDDECDNNHDGEDDEDEGNCARTYVVCFGGSIMDTIRATDPNPADMLSMGILYGAGSLYAPSTVTPNTGIYTLTPDTSGLYTVAFVVDDGTGLADTMEVTYTVTVSTPPAVNLPDDTTMFLCNPGQICLPLEVLDAECDITSITTNFGQYTGTLANFDQVGRINQLGGSISQIGGGQPGKVLLAAGDFVPPVNALSGVSVSLPNFVYADHVVNYGSFPNGAEPGNSADYLLGSPTDLTYTTPGAGGPDGGAGDGSIAFSAGQYCSVGFPQYVTACNGANVDFVIFTNTNGGGTATLQFKKDGVAVHSITRSIPGGPASSGVGGVTFDLPDGLTFNQVKVTCQSGTLEIDAFAARTAPSATLSDVCFPADTAGTYEIIATATDTCGTAVSDTTLVTVNLNRPPVANAGADFARYLCQISQVCFGVSFSDPDNNLASTQLYSGPGTLNGTQVCFTPSIAGSYTFVIKATDSCGLSDYDTVVVGVSLNSPPVASNPAPMNIYQCLPTQVCYAFTATDPNGGPLTWQHIYGAGSITPSGQFCFTPVATGTYSAIVMVSDSCGANDTTTITYNVTVNAKPVAVDPSTPVALSLCAGEQVCYQFTATDANGGTQVWTKLSGSGTLSSGGLWCFTPSATGAYPVTVAVADSCGAADTTTLTYHVTLNDPPQIAFGSDTTVALCAPQPICLSYGVSDPQGMAGLTEVMMSGFGSLDTAGNQICFTPTTAGCYDFIMRVADSCGAFDLDTIRACVSFGEIASIECPADTIDVSLCSADNVCQMLNVSPAGATITTTLGTYSDGSLCFNAAASGIYNARVVASTSCSADTCDIIFKVNISEPAQITCPTTVQRFICSPDTVCIPVSVNGTGVVVTVSPIGTYQSGSICFLADTSGHYVLNVTATTGCGNAACTIEADVTVNTFPVAVNPPSPVDTFVCQTGSLCYQFAASDANNETLSWSKLSGNGTISATGQWCFDVTSSGTYTVTAKVADSCGAADTVSLTYNITVDQKPNIALGNDTTIFICASGRVCVPYQVSDADANIESIQLLTANGVVDTLNSSICFIPPSAGFYQFIVKVTDSCQKFDIDTVDVTIQLDNAPVADAGADQNIFQCAPAQICWPVGAADPDGNLTTVELVNGPGTFDGTSICFTPNQSWCYEFVLKATDACGLTDFDTVAVCVNINQPPVANAGSDQTLFQCTPAQICWPVSFSDPDNNLVSGALVQGPGSYDGSSVCFTPGGSGSYLFVLEATDGCGVKDRDTVVINVTANSAPTCQVPNDTVVFQCAPAQVCLPAFGQDSDGNLSFCQVNVGTLSGNNWCYTPTSSQTVTVTMHCEDECGAICESEFTVEFQINEAPQISFGNDTTLALCAPQQICLPYFLSDGNAPRPMAVTLLAGPGSLDTANAQVCFTPSSDGAYTFIVKAQDECGLSDQDTINVTVDLNSAPVANAGGDQTLYLCDNTTEMCWPASCFDPDGNLTDCIFSGPGLYDGTSICFTPTASGDYVFSLRAIDECGAEMTSTATIHVTVNSAPIIAFGNDTTVALCTPEQICLPYSITDPNGVSGLIEMMVSGSGTIDTANNRICFTPTTAGTYEFIAKVKDSCLASDRDTISVTVSFGAAATIVNCPSGAIDVPLCSADEVCYMLTIQPSTATVTTSLGNYSGGNLCFQADTSGVYNVRVIATADCGADTCDMTFNVVIGTVAHITCPPAQQMFICGPQDVCIPVQIQKRSLQVTVSPIGTYDAGYVCFPADSSGHYVLQLIATTECGSDTCQLIADITIDSPPVAIDPTTPVDTFICTQGDICYQFGAGDPNGGTLTWTRLTGAGTVSTSGQWCFTADASADYSVTAQVADSCGRADTTTLTYKVTLNTAPVVALGADHTEALCNAGQLCYPYSVIDADNNVTSEQLVTSVGTLDTAANQLCFTPDTAGVYTFIVSVGDACGLVDSDTMKVTVHINSAPVVNAGTDQTMFLCAASQVCWNASGTDVDDNLDSCYIVGATGVYSSGHVCFTPDTAGVYRFILRGVDACGLSDQDTVLVTIGLNSPPLCELPGDTNIFQCSPTQISLPVSASDPDLNFDHCELLSGPGSIVGGQWVYLPTTNQSVSVKIMCVDACGASCVDSFRVSITLNSKPVVDLGPDLTEFLCGQQQICWPISVTDANNNVSTVELLTPNGTVDLPNSRICFSAPVGENTYTFIVKATDVCGAVDIDTSTVTIKYNAPPVLNIPTSFVAYLDEAGQFCFDPQATDEDNNLAGVAVTSPASYNTGSGEICFAADTTGNYCMTVTAVDSCGEQAVKQVCVRIEIDECIHVQIEKSHNSYQGQIQTLDIYLNGSGRELGGFDLLIAYDGSALGVTGAVPGTLFGDCHWEYFNYRFGVDGNCGTGCPSGLLHIIGIADMNNGAYHPSCFLKNMYGSLAQLQFLVSNDRSLECQYVPVKFFWYDCGDNSFSSRSGDTLWVSREVFDYEGNSITDNSHPFPSYQGTNDVCLIGEPGKPTALRCVDFTNGGIDIVCADSIDARGDVNLNQITYEIADAVLFSNYFVYGLQVFRINVEGQIAATDVNADGLTLSVADLVYMIRVVTGDAQRIPKLNPDQHFTAELRVSGDVLSITQSDTRVGAICLTIDGDARPELSENASSMELRYNFDGSVTRVLVFDLEGKSFLETGKVLKLNGAGRIKNVEIGSYDGYVMAAKVSDLPDKFSLSQNYPNPFNPTTTIEFALPVAAEWNLVIYNILGQEVESWNDKSEPGYVKVEWDAQKYASGVYFYRLKAGEFSSTKKMVLLK